MMHIFVYLFSKSFLIKKNCFSSGCCNATKYVCWSFCDHIGCYATLVDPNNNELEVLVNSMVVFLTKGWQVLLNFDGICLGVYVIVNFVGLSRFKLILMIPLFERLDILNLILL